MVPPCLRVWHRDSGGTIDKGELRAALFASAQGQQSSKVLDDRFSELDFNEDGDITFEEFLYGFTSWLGMDDDEEEE